jgi:hypothetical protein
LEGFAGVALHHKLRPNRTVKFGHDLKAQWREWETGS